MSDVIKRGLRASFRYAKDQLKTNAALRSLLYDVDNSGVFTDLYWHERMVGDEVRVDHYFRGIERHVKPGDIVVDLGTGSGILAFFASKHGAGKVYAIDHSAFIEVAASIARHNQLTNIEFVKKNSRDFALPERADIVVHEQIGDELFEENMIENLLDLKTRILKPGGKIVPGRFALYVEPVALKDDHRIPYIWENRLPGGIDYSFLREAPGLGTYRKDSYHCPQIIGSAVDYLAAEPAPLLSFDLNRMSSQDEIPMLFQASRTTARAGVLDGFCVYFSVVFDDDIQFDTSPLDKQTNWINRLFRIERRPYAAGETIDFTLSIKDLTRAETWTVTLR